MTFSFLLSGLSEQNWGRMGAGQMNGGVWGGEGWIGEAERKHNHHLVRMSPSPGIPRLRHLPPRDAALEHLA